MLWVWLVLVALPGVRTSHALNNWTLLDDTSIFGSGRERGGCIYDGVMYFNEGAFAQQAFWKVKLSTAEVSRVSGGPTFEGQVYAQSLGCAAGYVITRGGSTPLNIMFAYDIANDVWLNWTDTLNQPFAPGSHIPKNPIWQASNDGLHLIQWDLVGIYKFDVVNRTWLNVSYSGTFVGLQTYWHGVSIHNVIWAFNKPTAYLLNLHGFAIDNSTFLPIMPAKQTFPSGTVFTSYGTTSVFIREYGAFLFLDGNLVDDAQLYIVANNTWVSWNAYPGPSFVLAICSSPMFYSSTSQTLRALCMLANDLIELDTGLGLPDGFSYTTAALTTATTGTTSPATTGTKSPATTGIRSQSTTGVSITTAIISSAAEPSTPTTGVQVLDTIDSVGFDLAAIIGLAAGGVALILCVVGAVFVIAKLQSRHEYSLPGKGDGDDSSVSQSDRAASPNGHSGSQPTDTQDEPAYGRTPAGLPLPVAGNLDCNLSEVLPQAGDIYGRTPAALPQGGDLSFEAENIYDRTPAVLPRVEDMYGHTPAVLSQADDLYGRTPAVLPQVDDLYGRTPAAALPQVLGASDGQVHHASH